jgi:hypothetical protein
VSHSGCVDQPRRAEPYLRDAPQTPQGGLSVPQLWSVVALRCGHLSNGLLEVALDDPVNIWKRRQSSENLPVIGLMRGSDAEALALSSANAPRGTGHEADGAIDRGDFIPALLKVGYREFVGDCNLAMRGAAQTVVVERRQIQLNLAERLSFESWTARTAAREQRGDNGEHPNHP